MNYGFLIDNRKCIGCHACSTACKMENAVPLGVNRTWVKSVETGAYPDVRRHFQVTRCNHCANPPCVRICPVTAMYQRSDGIVEFDPKICIGCKACLQACPYDAIYIDPESGTAAKCHFCAHRTEVGLEPACVIVCPEHAIVAGDMDNPASEISRMLATQRVTVRKPEQGTAPKLFYIEGNEAVLHPTATARAPATFAFADVIPLHATVPAALSAAAPAAAPAALSAGTQPKAASGAAIRSPAAQGIGGDGPIFIGDGRMAEQMVQVAYNAQHKIPWHWPVPAYLVTKAIGAGAFLVFALGVGLRLAPYDGLVAVVAGALALLFIALTTGLLVLDLERPERFLSILTRPQWKSWLARGAFLLVGFSVAAGLWWLIDTLAWLRWTPVALAFWLRGPLLWLGAALAVGVACYTAFLFGQAEGRDLWQNPLLPVHLVIQALMAGSGALLVADLFAAFPLAWSTLLRTLFLASLAVDLFVTLVGEFSMPHASEVAARAAHAISHGRYRFHFWGGSVLLGHLLPFLLALALWPPALALAGLLAIAGLFAYEYAYVLAPQEIPNS